MSAFQLLFSCGTNRRRTKEDGRAIKTSRVRQILVSSSRSHPPILLDCCSNSFGGRIKCAEDKIRLFVNKKSHCLECRYSYPSMVGHRGRVRKRKVACRRACQCWKLQEFKERIKLGGYKKKLDVRLVYDASVIFGFLSLLVWLMELMLFDSYTGLLLIFCLI